jgi:hypothetical protein
MSTPTEEIIEALNKISDADDAWDTANDEGWADGPSTHECIPDELRDFVDTHGNVIAWNDQTNRWEHGGTLAEWLEGRS